MSLLVREQRIDKLDHDRMRLKMSGQQLNMSISRELRWITGVGVGACSCWDSYSLRAHS